MQCPQCANKQIVKNGSIHNGKQKYKCKACGRQFIEQPQQRRISAETKTIIERLLLERISLAGIARVTGVSERWLQSYVNQVYTAQAQVAQIRSKKSVA